ncbi:hypothetical protein A1O7_09784 [Cladophialophora yegresii CBS 114405]|uniref:3-oxoacyl-[acyl-carrier protein] reductase n=1 Tax=Cladophialophora yegresii CBS 114405 TaxID=1182544 RepID=W9W7A6_9EURO|nr:uncharacterized protein A1O7_09784 [Cladophialophora yegresii CBS 114405]EXJ54444.1 hypothetical protein A1O7_09784 [Cladophialophora yegresii CBS 114405]
MAATDRRVAIVTGAAVGIGEELSRGLVAKGWNVTGLDLAVQNSAADELSKELGETFLFIPCDVSKYDELATAFSMTFQKWGRIDAFCSNAGFVDKSSVYLLNSRGSIEIPPEPDLASTDVIYKGLIYGTQLAIHFMRQNPTPGGHIVATSSIAGLYPMASLPEYSGAKAAASRAWFEDQAAGIANPAPGYRIRPGNRTRSERDNITINAICPGVVPTRNIPQIMRDTFGVDSLTPRSTILAGYLRFLDDPSLNGNIIEASRNRLLFTEKPPYADGDYSKRSSTVFDPLFESVHGQPSGLEDIVRPLP